MLGTSGQIDMNMIWAVSVNDYRIIGQMLRERNVETAVGAQVSGSGEGEAFPERKTFELGIKSWVQTGQEKQGGWIVKEERTEYEKAQRHEGLWSLSE